MPDHSKGNNTKRAKDYTNVKHTYSTVVTSYDSFITVVTIKGPSGKCRVTIQGVPSQSRAQPMFPTSNPNKYNIPLSAMHLEKS